MQAEVPVAEPEPAFAAELRDGGEGIPGLLGPPPPAFLVGDACKRVQDAVDVGRDGEAEDLDVVADVDDRRDAGWIDRLDQTAQEARAPDAAGEDGDLHDASFNAWTAACVRGPARCCTRSRSSRVSTSSTRLGIDATTASSPRSRAARWKRSALRGPYSGSNRCGAGRLSAFVRPSGDATSAIPPRGVAASRERRSYGTTHGTSALTTSTASAGKSPSAAATAALCPPPGSSTTSAPASTATRRPSSSAVTTTVRLTSVVA